MESIRHRRTMAQLNAPDVKAVQESRPFVTRLRFKTFQMLAISKTLVPDDTRNSLSSRGHEEQKPQYFLLPILCMRKLYQKTLNGNGF